MGKIVVTTYITMDGVVEAPGGGEDFVHAGWSFRVKRGPEGDAFKLEEVRRSDALVFGRVTYEGMAAVWPHLTGEVADLFNGLPKFVVSSTLDRADWNNTAVLGGDLAEEVDRLKARFDRDIVVHGSPRLARALLSRELVDELRLMVFPLVLGAGKRLFDGSEDLMRFRLATSTTVGEGIAILTYVPVYEYVVSREMPADLPTVWRVWTEPEPYAGWFGAVPGSVRLDVRPGGRWELALPGDPPERLAGAYREVVPQQRLVMSTEFGGGETVMEMSFLPTPSGTRVEVRQLADSKAVRDGGREGSEILLKQCATFLGNGPAAQR